jgi:hypothetical protein
MEQPPNAVWILFITQYFDFILVDNEVSHSMGITSWKRYLRNNSSTVAI